ncbi:reverse transcriptase domain-containing protein [Tanacetum coccineum]
MIFHIDSAMKYSYSNDDTCFSIDVIDEILEEDFDALLDEGSEILRSIEGTILKEKIFAEFDKFMTMTTDENSESVSETEEPSFEKITFNIDYKIKHLLKNLLRILNSNLFLITRNMHSWKNPIFFRCMLAIFHDMIEESIEVFMDDFFVFGNSFDNCLNNLDKMFQHCKDAHLVLNWEKCHFMVKEGIMLGHKVSEAGLEVDKAKIDVISKLPPSTNIKAYKTPTRTTPYKLVYGKNCHLPFEIEHRAYWALKNCNPYLIGAGEKRMFQLHELDELRHQAYENSRLYKARTKVWHDRKLKMRKEFKHGNKVLLFHSKYKFKQPKLRSRWLGPYVVKHQYPSGYVELYGKDGKTFIVNGHRLKLYHEEEDYNDQREAVTPFFLKE